MSDVENAARGEKHRKTWDQIVLVGASVRAAAESAAAAGYRVIAIDQFGDRETLQAAQRWIPLGEFVGDRVRSGAGAVEIRTLIRDGAGVAIVGGINTGYRAVCDDAESFRGATPELFERVEDPAFLIRVAARASVAFPETVCSPVPPRGQHGGPGWLVKQPELSGGYGVRPWTRGSSVPPEAYLQRRIAGRVVGATFIADGRRTLLVGVSRLLRTSVGSLPCIFCGAVGPVAVSTQNRFRLVALADAFVAETGFCGPMNVDAVIDRSGRLWLLEINPRWSASMEVVEASWRGRVGGSPSFFDAFECWQSRIDRVLSETPSDSVPVFCKRVLFAREDQEVSPLGFPPFDPHSGWHWKDVPSEPTRASVGQPIATLVGPLGPPPHAERLRDAYRRTTQSKPFNTSQRN